MHALVWTVWFGLVLCGVIAFHRFNRTLNHIVPETDEAVNRIEIWRVIGTFVLTLAMIGLGLIVWAISPPDY